MAFKAEDGVWETTTTTGTGTLTLAGAKAGYRTFLNAVGSGDSCYYVIRSATAFELGIGVVSGSSLIRETVLRSTNSNAPVNFGAGVKDVFSPLPAVGVALKAQTNVWSAEQDFDGNRLILDGSGDSYLQATSEDIVDIYCGGAPRWRIDGPNAMQRLSWQDSGSGEGPEMRLYRDSASPASNDQIGVVSWHGKNGANADVRFGKIRGQILSPTAGSHSGLMSFDVTKSGGSQNLLNLRPDVVSIATGIGAFGAGKTSTAMGTPGWELGSDGTITAIVSNYEPLTLNRKDGDGTLISLRRDENVIGSVGVSGGVVSYGTFVGAHPAEWEDGAMRIEEIGTVVCAAQGSLQVDGIGYGERLSLVRPSTRPAEREVYGVVGGRVLASLGTGSSPRSLLNVNALGAFVVRATGRIRIGDLLESSDVPGTARAQADDIVRASTVGKATGARDGDDVSLVPCVLYCG